jgi:hypothetical protein
MRYVQTSLAVLLAASASIAGDVRKLDAPPRPDWQVIQCDAVLTVLQVEKAGSWELVDESPAAALRPVADGKTAAFAGPGGQYRVLVTTPDGVFRLKLIAPGPPQPMPPGPGPAPPAPPPAPVDPLAAKLQAAFALDARAAAAKESDRQDLVELYRQAAELAGKAEVSTTAALVQRIQAASKALGVDGLKEVRVAIATELAAQLGTDDAPLTPDSRAKAAAVFGRIRTALEAVK